MKKSFETFSVLGLLLKETDVVYSRIELTVLPLDPPLENTVKLFALTLTAFSKAWYKSNSKSVGNPFEKPSTPVILNISPLLKGLNSLIAITGLSSPCIVPIFL